MLTNRVCQAFVLFAFSSFGFSQSAATLNGVRNYCSILDVRLWGPLSAENAQKMVANPQFLKVVEAMLSTKTQDRAVFPEQVDTGGRERITREYISAFMIHFFPFELTETFGRLRADLTKKSAAVVSAHESLCGSLKRFEASSIDTEMLMELVRILGGLHERAHEFIPAFRNYIERDKMAMTESMIDKYIQIERRYLALKRREDVASFDFSRGFLSQLHGLERSIRRLSGENGQERLDERREMLKEQLSQEEYHQLSSLEIYRKKIFDRSFKLRVSAQSEVSEKLRLEVEKAMGQSGPRRQKSLAQLFSVLRRMILSVKPLKATIRRQIESMMSSERLGIMSEDLNGDVAGEILTFVMDKLASWGADGVHSDVRSLLSGQGVEACLPQLVSVLNYHIEKIAVDYQNFGLDLMDIDLLSELEDEQFAHKYENFDISLVRTTRLVEDLVRERATGDRSLFEKGSGSLLDHMLIRAASQSVDDRGLFKVERSNLPEVLVAYGDVFDQYSSEVKQIYRKSVLMLVYAQLLKKYGWTVRESQLAEMGDYLSRDPSVSDEILRDQAVSFVVTKLKLLARASADGAEGVQVQVNTLFRAIHFKSPVAELVKRRLKQQIHVFLYNGYFPRVTLSSAEQFMQRQLQVLLEKFRSVLLVIKKAHGPRVQKIFDGATFDQYFRPELVKKPLKASFFPELVEGEFEQYQLLIARVRKLAFVLHGLTLLRTMVNADSLSWGDNELSQAELASIVEKRQLKAAIRDDSRSLDDLKEEMVSEMWEITKAKELRFGQPAESTGEMVRASREYRRNEEMLSRRLPKNPSFLHMQRYVLELIRQNMKYEKRRGENDALLYLLEEPFERLQADFSRLLKAFHERQDESESEQSSGLHEPLPTLRSGFSRP